MKKSYLVCLALFLCFILIINGCGKLADSSVGKFVKKNQVAVAAGTAAVGLLLFLGGGGSSATTTTTTSTTTTTIKYTISGTVNFDSTSDGIRGGASISLIASSAVIATTTAEVDDGTYSFGSVEAGSYSLLASKSGWTIPSIEVVVTSESRTGHDFSANPDGWTILHTEAGITWETIAVDTIGTDVVYVAGNLDGGPIVWKSENEGTSWEDAITNLGTAESIVKIYFVSVPKISLRMLYVIDKAAMVFTSSYEVHSYETLVPNSSLTSETISDYSFVSGVAAFGVVTEDGWLLHYDRHTEWTNITPTNKEINGTLFLALGLKYAVGNDGYCGSREDDNWTTGSLVTTDNLREIAIIGSLESDFFAIIVSDNGSIFTSTDLNSWDQVLSGLPYALRGIYSANTTNLSGAYVVGENGLIMRKD